MRLLELVVPFLLLAACGGPEKSNRPPDDDDPGAAPAVSSTLPGGDGVGIAVNLPITATFSRAMDPTTLDASSFFLTDSAGAVLGVVTSSGGTATFTPAGNLAHDAVITATLTTTCRDEAGSALAAAYSWSFTTVAAGAAPEVSAVRPLDEASDVPTTESVHATFNAAMDPATLNAGSFGLTQDGTAVPGTVSYEASSNTATFVPAAPLGASLAYVATLTPEAKSTEGRALAQAYSWSFTTRPASLPALAVNLGTAGNYVILAQTEISTVPASAITGHIAISPAAATYITGFSLTADASNNFATSLQVTGNVYAADYAPPTSTDLTTAVTDMGTAFTDAAGRAADVIELGAGDIGGRTLPPGVYKWGTGLLIPTDVYLTGGATDVWIFQIAGDLTMASATSVSLGGGALPKNVIWQVSGQVTLDTTAHLEGVVLSQTAITLRTGASVNGRLLAQSAVSVDTSTVVEPAP